MPGFGRVPTLDGGSSRRQSRGGPQCDYQQTKTGSCEPAERRAMDDAVAIAPEIVARRPPGLLLEADPPGSMLRVSVAGGGCSGFQYKFDCVTAQADDDLVLSHDGKTVLVDPVSVQYMAGAEIDFVDDLIGSSFRINNPLATASCGCGTSFSV